MDVDQEEELGRWIDRAHADLARLPASSDERRQQERVIRRMEYVSLGYSINRANAQLRQLPKRSEESRRLSEAIDRMQAERTRQRREILSHSESRGGAGTVEIGGYQRNLAEVRQALLRACLYLRQPTAHAGPREAIVEIERALARLKEY